MFEIELVLVSMLTIYRLFSCNLGIFSMTSALALRGFREYACLEVLIPKKVFCEVFLE